MAAKLHYGRRENTTMELYVDPVCGMRISEEETVGTSSYEGKTYRFCSEGCKEQFDDDAHKFVHGSERYRSEETLNEHEDALKAQ
jgi:Cu+-exporting ATPase